ncbi:hypothetical protein [Streptomyces hokutonensis]|uniref:hypothetical protein n=1 Tax=Streptomyces hokutonensis TaxID=1306990 RepID=UPI0037F20E1E
MFDFSLPPEGALAVETGCPGGGHNLGEAHSAGGHAAYGEVLQEQEQEQESAAGN